MAPSSIGAPPQCLGAPALPMHLKPGVSATLDRVYFRDGDTKIRSLGRDGQITDVTTVPGSSSVVSTFAVSPDDKRIAVVVEDTSAVNTLTERIYVEDLVGGNHHIEIFHITGPMSTQTVSRWPMGWIGDRLILALSWICTSGDPNAATSSFGWHVVDAETGVRIADFPAAPGCDGAFWQSPSGVAASCGAGTASTLIYDWTGKAVWSDGNWGVGTALSPGGERIFLNHASVTPTGHNSAGPTWNLRWYTEAFDRASGVNVSTWDHVNCLWIDDQTMLAPDAITAFPSGVVTALPVSGQCAGRFPDSL